MGGLAEQLIVVRPVQLAPFSQKSLYRSGGLSIGQTLTTNHSLLHLLRMRILATFINHSIVANNF